MNFERSFVVCAAQDDKRADGLEPILGTVRDFEIAVP
jgi:hypothetical protein